METKIASTQNKIAEAIKNRWSARSFSDKEITSKEIETMLEAASWAPSSMNEQPWRYLVAKKGSSSFDKIIDSMSPGNQPWAKNASVLMVSLAKRHFSANGNLNRHHMYDTGAANATLLIQATEMNIYGHIIGGYISAKLEEHFDLDTNEFEIAAILALGYLDTPEKLDEPFKTRETTARSRKPLEHISSYLS